MSGKIATKPKLGYPIKQALYFSGQRSYASRVTGLSFSATYYYAFLGYTRWRPRSRVK